MVGSQSNQRIGSDVLPSMSQERDNISGDYTVTLRMRARISLTVRDYVIMLNFGRVSVTVFAKVNERYFKMSSV